MSKAPVRFGLVGFGAWGRFHAQSIAGNAGARLAAITVPSEASRAEAARLYPGTAIFTDHRAMLAAGDSPLDFDELWFVWSRKQSLKLLDREGPALVLAGSGDDFV